LRELKRHGFGRGPWNGGAAERALPVVRDAVRQLLEQELDRCRIIDA